MASYLIVVTREYVALVLPLTKFISVSYSGKEQVELGG